jgi:hypothetical protein
MPAVKNPLINLYFSERPGPDGAKYPILACKHCKWAKTNTQQALTHLDVCLGYTKMLSEQAKSSDQPLKRQQTLQLRVQSIPRAKKQKLDSAAALAVYITARPFCL